MCGIVVYFDKKGINRKTLSKLIASVEIIRHRGPDGAGVMLFNTHNKRHWRLAVPDHPKDVPIDLQPENYKDGSANLFLGHRRLSIFDLSSQGHQPMMDNVGNCIVFNGEIYNFLELRAQLKQMGAQFHTGTDTEVILAAYRYWGPECLKRFIGMWSFVLYDANNNQVFISNDRFGIKPLYYFSSSHYWVYASEIKAIRKVVNDKLEYHLENIRIFLNEGLMDFDETTLYKDIFRFKPANYQLNFPNNLQNTKFQPYWQFPTGINNYSSIEAAASEFRELFTDAVRLRMRSDVPWGTTLSGGLDSSSIVYTANELLKTQGKENLIHTFSAIFPGQEGDESSYINIIADDLVANAHYVNPLEIFTFDDLLKHTFHQDFPIQSTSYYAEWCVARLAKLKGIKVILNGQGGDEVFAGYHHHFYRYCRQLILQGKILTYLREVNAYSKIKQINRVKIHKTILNELKLTLKFKLGLASISPELVAKWNRVSHLLELLKIDFDNTMLPTYLRSDDRDNMAFSIESRHPYLDYRLVEFGFKLPDSLKINSGWQKWIIRKNLSNCPPEITWRKDKKGYTTPQQEWENRYQDEFRSYLPELEKIGILPKCEFRYYSLAIWLKN